MDSMFINDNELEADEDLAREDRAASLPGLIACQEQLAEEARDTGNALAATLMAAAAEALRAQLQGRTADMDLSHPVILPFRTKRAR